MFRAVGPGQPWIDDEFPMANRSAPWQPISTTVTNWMLAHNQDVEYRFNRWGYRGDWGLEHVNDAIWCLGDSQTLGLGVPEHQTWPVLLANKLNQRTINMAVAGCSNDTMSRLLLTAGLHYRPRAVLMLVAAPNRREIFSENSVLTCFPRLKDHMPDTRSDLFESYVLGLTDSAGDLVNRDRNLALMQACCELHHVPFLSVDFDRAVKLVVEQDPAADGMHIGAQTHEALAQWFADNISLS
jgi:hypothetical protein